MKLWPLILLQPFVVFAQEDPWAEEEWGNDWDDTESGIVWTGFVEAGIGTRFVHDELIAADNTLEDLRIRLESQWQGDKATIGFKADTGYDGIEDTWFADVRDLSISFTARDNTDVVIGRQVQTWGTGDLVFLNDLFPKDFVSFFAGRDDEYLKAPANSIRLTHYGDLLNADFVWTPVFEPDVFLTGERFSFFSPLAGQNIAPSPPTSAAEPDESLSNGEFALRLFKTIKSSEYAVYAYRGFFKQPNAMTPSLQPTFAALNSYGASMRRPAGPGLINAEFSWYDSRNDASGSNPLLPNDQVRVLLGYEWEPKANLTVGFQYYVERTLDYNALVSNSPAQEFEPDEYRHLMTNRLTYRAGMDKFTWSLFTFWSPSDEDFYLRPKFTYRHSDRWSITAGGNLFGGNANHTFFNQLQDASNAYLRVRFSY
jgi:hypothetical protein